MKITYCDGWFHFYKRPGDTWSAEKAKRMHDKGALYTVLVGAAERPTCFVDVRLEVGHVGVSFLDSELRVYLSYDFEKRAQDGMFLVAAATREYGGDSESPSLVTSYRFFPDGRVLMRREHAGGRAEEAETTADVSGNWEPLPSFGQYEGVIRLERGGARFATGGPTGSAAAS